MQSGYAPIAIGKGVNPEQAMMRGHHGDDALLAAHPIQSIGFCEAFEQCRNIRAGGRNISPDLYVVLTKLAGSNRQISARVRADGQQTLRHAVIETTMNIEI